MKFCEVLTRKMLIKNVFNTSTKKLPKEGWERKNAENALKHSPGTMKYTR